MPKGQNLDDPEPQTMAVIQYEWWFEYSGRGLVIGKEGWYAFYTHSDSRNVPVAGSVVCSLVRGRPTLPWQFDRGTLHVPRQCGKVQNQMGVVFGMGLPFGFPLNHQQRPQKKPTCLGQLLSSCTGSQVDTDSLQIAPATLDLDGPWPFGSVLLLNTGASGVCVCVCFIRARKPKGKSLCFGVTVLLDRPICTLSSFEARFSGVVLVE